MNPLNIERYVATSSQPLDLIEEEKLNIRPNCFDEYPGQDRVKNNLMVFAKASVARKKALDHVILHGPPGLGKTTLARILAKEMDVKFQQTSGPTLDKPGDLAGILAGIEPRSVLFIDEIHRLPIAVEELLYSAMEDFHIDILVGQGPTARMLRMPVNEFTLVGATTRMALLSSPLRSRFGIQERLDFYEEKALIKIIMRSAEVLRVHIFEDAAKLLAQRARGTPRVANRLLRRVRDFAEYYNMPAINLEAVQLALTRLEIDACGLDQMDRRVLNMIKEFFDGGPVGIETLAATLGEDKGTLEDVYEPYLLHLGFVKRGPRGREITNLGLNHLERLNHAN